MVKHRDFISRHKITSRKCHKLSQAKEKSTQCFIFRQSVMYRLQKVVMADHFDALYRIAQQEMQALLLKPSMYMVSGSLRRTWRTSSVSLTAGRALSTASS